MAKRTLLVLGCIFCGSAFLHPSDQFIGQIVAQETNSTKQPATAGKSLKAKRDEAVKAEAQAAVAEMIRKLGKGEYMEFLHQHSPIEE